MRSADIVNKQGRIAGVRFSNLWLALNLCVATFYFLSARLALELSLPNSVVSIFWPPSGLAVGFACIFGLGIVPGVAIGAFFANLAWGVDWLPAAFLGLGNAFEPIVAIALMRTLLNFDTTLARVHDTIRFLVSCVLLAPLPTALIGVGALTATGSLAGDSPRESIIAWWVGDGLGNLVFAPLVMCIAHAVKDGRTMLTHRVIEATALAVSLSAVSMFVFGGRFEFCFILFPLFTWSALRFGPRGVVLSAALVGCLALGIVGLVQTPDLAAMPGRVWTYQILLGTMTISSLLLASATTQLQRVDAVLEGHRLSESLLAESEFRFRQLAENMQGVFFMIDLASGRLLYLSPRHEQLLGRPFVQPCDKPELMVQCVHEDDRLAVNQAFARENLSTPRSLTYRVRHADGLLRWVWTRTFPIRDNAGSIYRVAGISEDITDIKSAEEALRAAKAAAEAANVAKSRFLANMSHEIRTPLGAMLGFSELLLEGNLPEKERRDHVGVIMRNGAQLLRIVDDVLDLSRVEQGNLNIEAHAFSLAAFLADLAESLKAQSEEKGLEFELVTKGPLPEKIHSDPARVKQILSGLVGNAIKFTERGRIVLEVQRSTGPTVDNALIVFFVHDTGRGLAVEHQKRLFEAFEQGDNSFTRRFGGIGIGLALCRQIAQAMGGECSLVRSELGKGSTFRFELPVGDLRTVRHALLPGGRTLPVQEEASLPVGEELLGMRILLVDDALDTRVLMSRVLALAGADVTMAANGLEGCGKALSERFDVVLMDLQMPILDGYEAMARLRQRGYERPVVALTARSLAEERSKCQEAGFAGHLSKPVNKHHLFQTLRNLSSSRRPPETGPAVC